MEVIHVATEMTPLAQAGGLGDVLGGLPPALRQLGFQVQVVLPLFSQVDRKAHNLHRPGLKISVNINGEQIKAEVWTAESKGCPVYLIAQDHFFNRPGIYGDAKGDYPDNNLRFIFFNQAVIKLVAVADLHPRILHVHDWQPALLPAYIKARTWEMGNLGNAATVLTIHNLAHQGLFPRQDFSLTGLPQGMNTLEGMEFWGKISFLKAGLVYTDALTTVSPSYAAEILTPQGGMGLDGVLQTRSDSLFGILNGVDYSRWSPESDEHLPAKYSAQDLSGKEICRRRLLEAFGLEPAEKDACVLGFVGRLTEQKGVDLIAEAAPGLLRDDIRLCVLGQGQAAYEKMLSQLARKHPGKVGVRIGFDESLAHLLVAGSDLLLMPSRFEPCGLNQMHAMHYGTPPLVRPTGGLKDTVEAFDPAQGQGTGFVFWRPSPEDLLSAIRQAILIKARGSLWQRLQQNCLAQDFSWDRSARAYADLYRRLAS
ncbi:MAG: glycogen synthase GlgA [Desulfarculaceae bacterium]|jgi:starch synthase